jgi:hypothetical protein
MIRILLFFVFIYLSSLCAVGQITFNKQFDTEFPFLAFTNVYPTDSCFYTTGVMTDSTSGFLTIGNVFHKFDLEGNIQLQSTLGSPEKYYQIYKAGLVPTLDEGLVTLGLTTDTINKATIIKFNNQGDTLFTKEFLNPYYPDETFIYAATIRPNDEYGFWILIGIDADPNASNGDIYLLRVDSNGNIITAFIYGNNQNDTPFGLLPLTNNGVIIGSRKSNIGQTNNNFFSRTHIFEIDEPGEIQWEYLSPPNQLVNYPTNLIPTPDGGLIASSGIGTILEVNPSTDYILWSPYFFKLNADHELEWARAFRGLQQSTDFTIREMVAAPDGSGYVGISRTTEDVSIGEEVLGSWIMKVSPEGDSLWVRHYSVFDTLQNRPTPYDIKATPDGGYIIVGQTSTRLVPGTQPVPRGWLLKVDEYGCLIPGCQGDYTNTKEADEHPLELAIFPNPTADFLNFELRGHTAAPNAYFRIIDSHGRVLQQIPADQVWGTGIVPVHDWSSGTYWVQYVEEGMVSAFKGFIVQ